MRTQNLFYGWIFLELNLIAFLTLLYRLKQSRVVLIKYYSVQIISSLIFLGGILIIIVLDWGRLIYIVGIALLLKLGLAPFHWWIFRLLEKVNWLSYFYLIGVQKVIPLYLLRVFSWNSSICQSLFLLNGLLGAIMGFYIARIRKILGISSIVFFRSIVILAIDIDLLSSITIIYLGFNYLFFIFIKKMNVYFLSPLWFKGQRFETTIIFYFYMITSAGLPPIVIFFLKYTFASYLLIGNSTVLWGPLIFFLILSIWIIFIYVNSCTLPLTFFRNKKIISADYTSHQTNFILFLRLNGLCWFFLYLYTPNIH